MTKQITLRNFDGSVLVVPNQKFDPIEMTPGILTAKRPTRGSGYGNRTTMLTIAVAQPRVDDSALLNVVSLHINTSPEILSQMLADASDADVNLDLTLYQVFQVGGPTHNSRLTWPRGRSLSRTRANAVLAELGVA